MSKRQSTNLEERVAVNEARATGMVTGHQVHHSGAAFHRLSFPVVRFETARGETVEFESGVGSNIPPRVGEEVRVIYDPARPQEARLYAGSAIRPRRWMLLTGAAIFVCAFPVFVAIFVLSVVLLAAG